MDRKGKVVVPSGANNNKIGRSRSNLKRFLKKLQNVLKSCINNPFLASTASKVSAFGVILVRIFPHLD